MRKLFIALAVVFGCLVGPSFADTIVFGVSPTTSVSTLAQLKALIARPATVVMAGRGAAGDGGGGTFSWFAGDTSTADDAIIVTPTNGQAGRYKRLMPSAEYDLRWWTACDGTTNNATGLTAASATAAAAGGGVIRLPGNCLLNSTVTLGSNVTLRGQGIDRTSLIPGSANLTLLTLGTASGVLDMKIDMSGYTNSSGCALNVPNGALYSQLKNLIVYAPFQGVCSAGSYPNIENVNVLSPTQTTGKCFAITGGTDAYVKNSSCGGIDSTHQPSAAIKITGGGGHKVLNFNSLYSGNGLWVLADGVSVEWVYSALSVFDSGSGSAFLLQAANSGVIKGFHSDGDWGSSSGVNGVLINQDTGTIDGARFVGLRAFTNGHEGVALAAGTSLAIQNSQICGNSASASGTYPGVRVDASAINVLLNGNTISNCAVQATSQSYGIVSNSSILSIQGNKLSTNITGPLSLATAPTSATIENNIGIDDVIPTVASASSIALPPNPVVVIGGTAAVATMTGIWNGRKVTLIPSSTATFTTGGNILTAPTSAANVPNFATYVTGFSGWAIR